MNDGTENYFEECSHVLIKALSQHLPGGAEQTMNNACLDNWCPCRDLKQSPLECKCVAVLLQFAYYKNLNFVTFSKDLLIL